MIIFYLSIKIKSNIGDLFDIEIKCTLTEYTDFKVKLIF